jgi:hypothetical protein
MVECVRQRKQTLTNVYEASHTQAVVQAIYDAAYNDSEERVQYYG